MMAEMDAEVVSSEDDLWALLQSLLDGSIDGRVPVKLDGWRPEILYFPEEPTGHTVSPATARAITDLHRCLSRSYAYLAYGEANASNLQHDDKAVLDVRFLITDGSSGVEIEDIVLDAILAGLVSKMTGEQITIGVVVFLALYFSHSVGRHWINRRYEEKQHSRTASEREKLSEEETKRAEILSQALSSYPELSTLEDTSEEARRALVGAARAFPRSRVVGADLTSAEAKVILSRDREKGVGKRVDGQFEIARINPEYEGGFLFRLKDAQTNEEMDAEANYDELPQEDIHLLFEAAENKDDVYALVNAWTVRGRVSRARIVRVNKPNDGEHDDPSQGA